MKTWQRLCALTVMTVTLCTGAASAAPAPATMDAGTHTVLLAGSVGGTILRDDAGTQWQRRQSVIGGVSAFTADASGRTIYATTNEGELWRSGDAGRRWVRLNSPVGAGVALRAIVLNPQDPNVVDVATADGIVQSLDAGATWTPLGNGLPYGGVYSLVIDPRNPANLWAGTDGNGLYHSADGGSTWTEAGASYLSNLTVMALALSPATNSVIYAGTSGGLYQSVDGGATWQLLGGDLIGATNVFALAVSPVQPDRVYAGTNSAVFVSSDGGSTWTQGGDLGGAAVQTLAADPVNAAVAFAGTDSGIYRTADGGATWGYWNGADLGDNATVTALAMVRVRQVPADAVGPACCGARYFTHTGHNLSGPFLRFWQRYGGVDVFGYPRTEGFIDGGRWVQYTDRFRLELVNGRVVTAPLGRLLTAGRYFAPVAAFHGTAGRLYFTSTRHGLSGRFLRYWQTHHGALLLGAPIAEPTFESNADGTNRRYEVQWFEKGRLEFHPELAGTRYEIQGGLTGKQDLQRRGWL